MADKDEAAAYVADDEMVDEVVERLLDKADASGAALLGEGGLLTEITRAVLERALEAEMSEHLGYERGDPAGHGSGNSRNGTSPKTVLTDAGAVTLAVPRDRNGDFEPRLVPKNVRRLAGFNARILFLYARGMSVRDIRSHLAQIYGVEVSPDLISKVTDAVIDELVTWQNRPLDAVWPIIYIDALWVKIRSGSVTLLLIEPGEGQMMNGRRRRNSASTARRVGAGRHVAPSTVTLQRATDAQRTQVFAAGRTSRRSVGIGSPHCSQRP
ncbi:transposase [Streptomyces mirabilis]